MIIFCELIPLSIYLLQTHLYTSSFFFPFRSATINTFPSFYVPNSVTHNNNPLWTHFVGHSPITSTFTYFNSSPYCTVPRKKTSFSLTSPVHRSMTSLFELISLSTHTLQTHQHTSAFLPFTECRRRIRTSLSLSLSLSHTVTSLFSATLRRLFVRLSSQGRGVASSHHSSTLISLQLTAWEGNICCSVLE